ncbi:hypothetical protein [Paraburkholderia sp. Ac-20340]|nr:hypothetical protein [Paraburkholderia sp. Ac-20340]
MGSVAAVPLSANNDLLAHWLAGVTTARGGDALQAVNAALGPR